MAEKTGRKIVGGQDEQEVCSSSGPEDGGGVAAAPAEAPEVEPKRRSRKRAPLKLPAKPRIKVNPQERFLILDTWLRSKLPAKNFAPMVGVSAHTLYKWKKLFEEHGPAGLEDKPRGPQRGSKMNDVTRRMVVRLKETNPDWGVQRIHDVLIRSEGFFASAGAIRRLLHEEGLMTEPEPPKRKGVKKKRGPYRKEFPNDSWQSDLHSFNLRRWNRTLWVVGYLDDHSSFMVGHGLYASQSGELVRGTLKEAIASFGRPKVIQTDRGSQYYSKTGTSKFETLLAELGIGHKVVPDPSKNGKIERFWKTLKNEFLEKALFRDFEDARVRLGHYMTYYNFQRPHQGIDGLAPADRYFQAAPQVRAALLERVAENARELAVSGLPRKTFYLTGRMGDASVSLHTEGDRLLLTKDGGVQEEVNLSAGGPRIEGDAPVEMPDPVMTTTVLRELDGRSDDFQDWPPGVSPLDEALERLEEGLEASDPAEEDPPIPDDSEEGEEDEDGPKPEQHEEAEREPGEEEEDLDGGFDHLIERVFSEEVEE